MNTQNPYAPPRANVADVVADAAELELAGRGIRLGAAIVDTLLVVAAIYVPIVLGGVTLMSEIEPMEPQRYSAGWLLAGGVGTIVLIVFNVLYVSRNGQSIAKKWLGIKVVRSTGEKASLGRIFWLRNVVNGLLAIIPFYQIIDPLLIFGERRQCAHDKIADTIVVVA